jgi:hypothetical protein
MDKITGVLDALQGIFGKGFALAGFLPVILVTSISWIVGCWLWPSCRDLSDYFLQLKLTQQFAIAVLALLLISMISFVFWLLNPVFRQILEGRIFPISLQDVLANRHRRKMEALENEKQGLFTEFGSFREAEQTWPAELMKASTGAGQAIQDQSLLKEYDALKSRFEKLAPVKYSIVEEIYNRLIKELNATLITVQGLQDARDGMIESIIPAGKVRAQRAFFRKLLDRSLSYPSQEISLGPTRLANIQEAQRDYVMASYGIDLSVFWSDLQKIASDDEKFAGTLEQTKLRLDFAVAMTAVSAIFTLGWIILHFFTGNDVTVYVVVAATALAATLLCHRLVFINYSAFAETSRTAVELYRFKLMKALHLELPKTTDDEQKTWFDLADRLEARVGVTVKYDHT